MADDSQRLALALKFVGGIEPANAGRSKNLDRNRGLNERQVSGMTGGATVGGYASVRMLGRKPGFLRRQGAGYNQQGERQFREIPARDKHFSDYTGILQPLGTATSPLISRRFL